MGYESLSTLVVLVIIAIIMMVWLPRSTAKGMKQVVKHRSDRYSASLHLLDERNASRFSDVHTPTAKGAIMPTTRTDREKNRAYIAQVRELRRAAARRRSILADTLVVITAVVVALAFVLDFSPLYALIPAALLVLVLILGARAAAKARAWEAKMAERQRKLREKEQKEKRRSKERQQAREERRVQERREQERRDQAPAGQDARVNEARTDVMEQREIRRALRQARQEQAQAVARHQEQAAAKAAAQQGAAQAAQQAAPATPAVSDQHAQLVVRGDMERYLADETNELNEVRSSSAVDAFDMAVNQDLISFSLGEERNGVEQAAPVAESLEIKSTKQVAKAVPPESTPERPAAEAAEATDAAGEAVAADTSKVAADNAQAPSDGSAVNDSVAFHESERSAAVEAPEETSDSLGADLASILARRGN